MIRGSITKRAGLLAGALATVAGGVLAPAPLAAQEVVQALPPRATAELNAALRRLAQRPADLEALLSAGNASLSLRDAGAASGFFARAARVAPDDGRVLLGQARVALEQGRPVEALQGFAKAESAGVRPLDMAADRALAFDLVGDNASAQALYRSVLAAGDSDEVRRRLALSYAIAGNRSEFERALYPLLRDEDRAAYRTRAFGLAILGLPDDAVEIADAMMPTDLALRMAPYLRYMPRLTKAQQAAAGNLGSFPAATEIGRDSPAIAGYAGAGARIASSANTSLTPAGTPLGTRRQQQPAAENPAVRRRPDRESEAAARPTPAPTPALIAGVQPSAILPAARQTPTAGSGTPGVMTARSTAASGGATPDEARSVPAASATPGVIAARPVVVAVSPPSDVPQPDAPPARQSLSEAFADLGAAPVAASRPAAGAVDVARLAAAREAEETKARKEADARAKAKREADAKAAKAKAEKAAKEAEPARIWVQLGVGRNTAAFAFDWKKLARQAGGALDGKGPWAARYGATNRMLAGPFPTEAAATAAIKRLKDKDIEALPFASSEGEKITRIG